MDVELSFFIFFFFNFASYLYFSFIFVYSPHSCLIIGSIPDACVHKPTNNVLKNILNKVIEEIKERMNERNNHFACLQEKKRGKFVGFSRVNTPESEIHGIRQNLISKRFHGIISRVNRSSLSQKWYLV